METTSFDLQCLGNDPEYARLAESYAEGLATLLAQCSSSIGSPIGQAECLELARETMEDLLYEISTPARCQAKAADARFCMEVRASLPDDYVSITVAEPGELMN